VVSQAQFEREVATIKRNAAEQELGFVVVHENYSVRPRCSKKADKTRLQIALGNDTMNGWQVGSLIALTVGPKHPGLFILAGCDGFDIGGEAERRLDGDAAVTDSWAIMSFDPPSGDSLLLRCLGIGKESLVQLGVQAVRALMDALVYTTAETVSSLCQEINQLGFFGVLARYRGNGDLPLLRFMPHLAQLRSDAESDEGKLLRRAIPQRPPGEPRFADELLDAGDLASHIARIHEAAYKERLAGLFPAKDLTTADVEEEEGDDEAPRVWISAMDMLGAIEAMKREKDWPAPSGTGAAVELYRELRD
jgi:hypothetical protein